MQPRKCVVLLTSKSVSPLVKIKFILPKDTT